MKVARFYSFEMEFREDVELPRWKGNIVRNAIGFHLKRKFCLMDEKCESCPFVFKCPFGYLYRAPSKGMILRKIKGYTKPYVIKPPLNSKTSFSKGDEFNFSIVLFGDSTTFEMPLLISIQEMARSGLGRKGKRGRLLLRRVTVENPFKKEKEILYENGQIYSTKTWITERNLSMKLGKVFILRFLTPFMLVKGGEVLRDLKFGDLLSFMLRKMSAIYHQYLGKKPGFNARDELIQAERVRLVGSRLREIEFEYKGEKQVFLSGDLVYAGKLSTWMRRALAFCQLSHIGKRSSFGFGWYEVIT